MQQKINSQGAAMPIVVGAIAVIAIIAAIIWTMQNPSSQKSTSDDAMIEKTDTTVMEKTDDEVIMEKNTNDSMMKKPDENTVMEKNNDNTTMEKEVDAMIKPAPTGYIIYSSQAYAEAEDQKRVLFFHATWCPTCKVANADFIANAAKIPLNIVVFKTDYDTEATLKKKYGITYQHTFVLVDAEGNAITKWNGGGVNEVLSNIK